MIEKPQLKTIGSIVGMDGWNEILQYLNQQFTGMGFHLCDTGVVGLAQFKGIINGQEITVSISINKHSKHQGITQDQQIRYRTFQGVRVKYILPNNLKTRLVIARKTQGKWLTRFTHWAMKLKKFKTIDKDYLDKEVYSPDKLFAQAFINDRQITNTLSQLTAKDTQCISWGLILIPEQLNFNRTFTNLDDFETTQLQTDLSTLVNLVKAIENKPISQELTLDKAEVLARDNPKKSLWRAFMFILLFMVFVGLFIGLLLFLAMKFGEWIILVIGIIAYIVYKKV
jgi:hypothetical protein